MLLISLIPIGITAAGLGILAGLVFKRTIPSFVISLALSFTLWILGSAFGLAQGFGGLYARLILLTINTHTVYLIFKQYFGFNAVPVMDSTIILIIIAASTTLITSAIYQKRLTSLE